MSPVKDFWIRISVGGLVTAIVFAALSFAPVGAGA